MVRLTLKALASTASGTLTTIVSGELKTVEKSFWMLPYIFAMPMTLIACFIYFGFFFYESTAIAFFALLLLTDVFAGLIGTTGKWRYFEGKHLVTWRRNLLRIGKESDTRVKYISEIINGIKTIKAYCLEFFYYNKVSECREKQLKYVRKTEVVYSIAFMFAMSSGYLMSIILFGYHWGVGRKLEYSSAMASLTMITYISFRNILLFHSTLSTYFRFDAICKRSDEVIEMEE